MPTVIVTLAEISHTETSISFSITTDNYLGGVVTTYVYLGSSVQYTYSTPAYGYVTRTYTFSGLSPGTQYWISGDAYGATSGTFYTTSSLYVTTSAPPPFFPPYFPFFPFFPFFPPFFPYFPTPNWSGSGSDVTLAVATEGIAYSDAVVATDAVSYVVYTGQIPAGLSLNSSGTITGTPETGSAGTYNLTFTATASGGSSTSGTITLYVIPEAGQLFVYNSDTSHWDKAIMNTFEDVGGTPTPVKNTVYIYNSTTAQWEISQG